MTKIEYYANAVACIYMRFINPHNNVYTDVGYSYLYRSNVALLLFMSIEDAIML